jgi:hypothetical protein
MRLFGGFGLALIAAVGLFGQVRGGGHGGGGFSHGGGFYRGGGGYSSVGVYGSPIGYGYGYSGYLGSYGYGYDSSGYGYAPGYADAYGQQAPQQPNVTVVYPPPPTSVIIQFPPPDGGPQAMGMQPGPPPAYGAPFPRRPAADDATSANDAPHYLIAFKDRTIYSAIAYWVDGDTLHYFTTGNTHNQVSLALVDRDLTARLNQESGVDLKLPPPAPAK